MASEREPGDRDGSELVELRQALGLDRARLAAIAGMPEEEIAAIEAGRRPLPPELLAELMEELNAKGA